MSNPKKTIKIVLVGCAVGKTCLIERYVNDQFSCNYTLPTVFDDQVTTLTLGQTEYTLKLHDTSGNEDYDRLRPLNYPKTDIFLVCYSVVVPLTMEYVKEKWVPEILQYCPKARFILVGTQSDLRDNEEHERFDKGNLYHLSSDQSPISYEEGVQVAKKVKAVKYVECSAFSKVGVKGVFEEAIIAAISPHEQEIKQTCCVS